MEPQIYGTGQPKSADAFYFVKIHSFEDPRLREKLVDAESEFHKAIEARSKIIEAVRAKKMERSTVISELKPLTSQNKQYNEVTAEKSKEIEPPQNRSCMFLKNNDMQIIDGIRKEQQAVRSKIRGLEDELKVLDTQIASYQEDLDAATARKDNVYESLMELRKVRDAKNASLIENRSVLCKARDYALRRLVTELGALHEAELDKFMAQWCKSKAFREDYEKRTISSLNVRQLDRDGRMRIPDC